MTASAPSQRRASWSIGRLAMLAAGLIVIATLIGGRDSPAQLAGATPGVRVPGFWDPRRRPEQPDVTRLTVVRFLTEVDFPPFNFAGPDGHPQGFNVDLAR